MFYTVSEQWIDLLKSNYLIIKNELDLFLKNNHSNIGTKYSNYVSDGEWKTIPLIFFTIKNHELLQYFPETTNILSKIPELIGSEFWYF